MNTLNKDTKFVPTVKQSISLIPSKIKDILLDVFYKNPNFREIVHNDMRGNVQHRIGGVLSEKEHDEIVLKAAEIIGEL